MASPILRRSNRINQNPAEKECNITEESKTTNQWDRAPIIKEMECNDTEESTITNRIDRDPSIKNMEHNSKEVSPVIKRSDYTWEEIRRHTSHKSKWLVIDNEVYDITRWSRIHPGTNKIISHYAGQNASSAFRAFHPDLDFVQRYLKSLHIGSVNESERLDREVDRDVEEFRIHCHKMGWFKPSYFFFAFMFLQVIFLECLAVYVLYRYGDGWIPFVSSIIIMTSSQMQAGWLQHDFGHVSCFKKPFWNHIFHKITFGFMMGSSGDYWNHMHNQHHAKPNVMDRDPDVRLGFFFVFGRTMAINVAKLNRYSMPFEYQPIYFWALPVVHAIVLHPMTMRHMFNRKQYIDFLIFGAFFLRVACWTLPLLGVIWAGVYGGAFSVLYFIFFDLVSQSNHIVMPVEEDEPNKAWLHLQLESTCNVEKSLFNDWFTGHLNHQIEHHLFPTMPRHNLHKVTPLAKELCEKHGAKFIVKSLPRAFFDIFWTLFVSGQIWRQAHDALYPSTEQFEDY